MTTYKEIFGKPVKVLSTDPTDTQAEGQVWYNTTSGTFKTVTAVGAWSSGGNLPQVVSYNSGAGTQTAALSIGGQAASTSAIQNTYEYDGSSWSDGGPVAPIYPGVSSYYGASCGTQTAALIVGGGSGTNATGEYNGSSWTATGNYPVTTFMGTANGIQTAAINIGGRVPPGSVATGIVANYNGSTWTASPVAISPAQYKNSSAGTSTATIVSGGITPSATVTTAQEWNGSSWTTVGAPSAPKSAAKSTGIQTLALKMYGTTGGTEQYNGSSWTTVANQAIVRDWATGGGSNDSSGATGVMFGGKTPSGSPAFTAATEEFTTTVYSPIAATWASGGNMPTIGSNICAFGTQTAAVISGRSELPGNNFTTLLYNGTSWTNNPAGLNTSRLSTAEAGTQTAGLIAAGFTPASSPSTATEEFNGSSWTTVASVGTATYNMASGGTQTTAWKGGGATNSNATEEYDGSSWTAGGNMLAPQYYNTGTGTQTAAMAVGGRRNNSPPANANTEEYDGSSWTAGGNYPAATFGLSASGTQIDALYFGGTDYSTASNSYNGTSWASQPSIATGRQFSGFPTTGTSTSAFMAGGRATGGAATAATEEFTGETFVLGYKTLTSS
jgi:hypothetical protein